MVSLWLTGNEMSTQIQLAEYKIQFSDPITICNICTVPLEHIVVKYNPYFWGPVYNF